MSYNRYAHTSSPVNPSVISRRDFVRRAIVGAAAVGAGMPRLLDCGSSAGTPRGERRVWAWLRMFTTSGPYSVPHSEAAYKAQRNSIDVVLPTNGGKLQADGSWLQESWKLGPDWPQRLPALAKQAGQLYVPAVTNDRDGIFSVLINPGLQQRAADNLVELATVARFDSPWDGVLIDLEGVSANYLPQMSRFLRVLVERIKRSGLTVYISVRGRSGNPGVDSDDGHDLTVVSELADYVDLRCYNYLQPPLRSIAPYWWIESCINYALERGANSERTVIGLANFSRYWPDSSMGRSVEITHQQAMELVVANDAKLEWIERGTNGLVNEQFARLGIGHVWVNDGSTHERRLRLIDAYELLGTATFATGMGDKMHAQLIGEWRQGAELRTSPSKA